MLGLGRTSVLGRANAQATDHILVQIPNGKGRQNSLHAIIRSNDSISSSRTHVKR